MLFGRLFVVVQCESGVVLEFISYVLGLSCIILPRQLRGLLCTNER